MKTPSLLTSPQTPLPGSPSQSALQSPGVRPSARRRRAREVCTEVCTEVCIEVCTAAVRRDRLLLAALSATLPAPATIGCSATVYSLLPILYTMATTLPLNEATLVLVTRKPSRPRPRLRPVALEFRSLPMRIALLGGSLIVHTTPGQSRSVQLRLSSASSSISSSIWKLSSLAPFMLT